MARILGLHPNVSAFLDMIAASELASMASMPETDEGYKVIVGSTPSHLDLMTTYATHPHKVVVLNPHLSSTAAGRYQILARYFDVYQKQLNLPDFSPESQDRIAIQMLHEVHAIEMLEAGHFEDALKAASSRWASLPGAGYQQHENTLESLKAAYVAAGGKA